MPIDSALPEFMNVPRIPEAAPRWLAGTLFMIEVAFGAAKSPDADAVDEQQERRTASRRSPPGCSRNPMKVAATRTSPPVANSRAPYRSESRPAIGPATRKPTVSGNR